MSANLKFITAPARSQQQIESEFVRLQHRLLQDPAYHFSVMVTGDWKVVELDTTAPTPETPLQLVGQLKRVTQPVAELNVMASLLAREIHPADWLEVWLAGTQQRIVGGRRVATPFGDVGDYLAISAGADEVVSRTIAIKDGNRLFALAGEVARADYAAVADELLLAAQSFQLLNPSGEYFAEEMRVYTFDQPLRGSFPFPASWVQREDPVPPPRGASFSLLNPRGEGSAGQFSFASVPRRLEWAAEDLFLNYAEQLERNDVRLEQRRLTRDDQKRDDVLGSWSAELNAEHSGTRLEVLCRIHEHEKGWLLLALVGPSRESEPQAQIINRRAFDVAVRGLELAP
jgi:hypothetical protein